MSNGCTARMMQHWLQLDENDRRMSESFLSKAVALLKGRSQFESEFIEKGNYLFVAPASYDQQVIQKKWKPEMKKFFLELQDSLTLLASFNAYEIENTFKVTAATNNYKPGEVLQLFRIFLSGQSAGVDLFPMAELLGKDEVNTRLNAALKTVSA
jgi:glutamyl-tRNA synthetase